VFRLKEHVARLFDSARIVEIAMSYDHDAIETAILDTLRANRMSEGYIRPLVYLGAGAMASCQRKPDSGRDHRLALGAYLGEEGLERGIRAKVSSYARHHRTCR